MKQYIKWSVVVIAVILMSAFTVKTGNNTGYKIGDIVEDFKLENVDGTMLSMSSFKDAKGFIITFTCNTCPFSVAYEDRINDLNKKYSNLGYPVIAIMPNNVDIKPGDNMEAMKIRAKEKDFTFPYLIDKKQNVYPIFGATKTPHVYILEKNKAGYVVKYIGAIDDNYKDAKAVKVKYVEQAIDALLAGKDIEIKETKAIGCSIKA